MLFKKNPLYLLSFILSLIAIFLHPIKAQAEVVCTEWDRAITKNQLQQNYFQEERNDIGVFYDFEWDKEKKVIKIKRNAENYPIIRFSLFNKTDIAQGSIIKSYNDINLSKISDIELEKIHRQNKDVELELISGNIINLNSKLYQVNDIKMESFGLNTIQSIEATKGIVEISLNSLFSHKRADLLKILKDDNVDNNYSYKDLCSNTIDENDLPIEKFYFDEFLYDEDLRVGLNNKTIINSPIISLTIDDGSARIFRVESGVSSYRQDFQFEKFPFDKQKIKFVVMSGETNFSDASLSYNGEKPNVTFVTPEKGAFLNLEELKENNYLKEWEIVSTNILSNEQVNENSYDVYSGKITTDSTNTLVIEIEIKRNYEQYIFKIIIPVFLILSLAWFVLWIPTKEFETRLTTSMVALLSLIAYNFVFADDVPKLNYLTALDEYILMSYIFCCIPTFMSIWFSRFISTNQKKATLVNRKIRVWGVGLYIVASLWIFFPK